WMGEWLDLAKPKLAPNGSVWVFASPAMTSSVDRLIAERFRPLNSIRGVKEAGWHNKAELSAMRRYLTPWEGIVVAEQCDDHYGDMAHALQRGVFAPIRRYLQAHREKAGMTAAEVSAYFPSANGGITGRVHNWEVGRSFPTEKQYEMLRGILNLRREYEVLRREYEDLRRPFRISG